MRSQWDFEEPVRLVEAVRLVDPVRLVETLRLEDSARSNWSWFQCD